MPGAASTASAAALAARSDGGLTRKRKEVKLTGAQWAAAEKLLKRDRQASLGESLMDAVEHTVCMAVHQGLDYLLETMQTHEKTRQLDADTVIYMLQDILNAVQPLNKSAAQTAASAKSIAVSRRRRAPPPPRRASPLNSTARRGGAGGSSRGRKGGKARGASSARRDLSEDALLMPPPSSPSASSGGEGSEAAADEA